MRLMFFDNDTQVVSQLRTSFMGSAKLYVQLTDEIPFQDVDALYLSFVAAERWKPRFIMYESQVLKTERRDNEKLPDYIVAGILMKRDDIRAGDPHKELSLVISAVMDAVDGFNKNTLTPINSVGFWIRDLSLEGTDISAAGEIIRSAYEQHYLDMT